LMPETESLDAKNAGEKVRLAVQNAAFDVHGKRVTSTVSIGIAGFPGDSNHVDVLLDYADKALYESKRQGRNRVTRYSDFSFVAA